MAPAAPIVAIGTAEFIKMVMIALGVTAGTAVAIKTAKDLGKTENKADDIPTVVPLGLVQECKDCPAKQGAVVQMEISGSNFSIEYQAFATQWPIGVEWCFRGVNFDAFKEIGCVLEEAKGKYQQFLDKEDPTKWARWFKGQRKLLEQARAQARAAQPSPPIYLVWYFHELPVMMVLGTAFQMEAALDKIVCIHKPKPEKP